jgi:hypothetical protein
MIKTVFFYIFYISCVNATFNLRHLTYATGMEGPRYLRYRHLDFATGMEGQQRYLSVKETYDEKNNEFANVYDSYY